MSKINWLLVALAIIIAMAWFEETMRAILSELRAIRKLFSNQNRTSYTGLGVFRSPSIENNGKSF